MPWTPHFGWKRKPGLIEALCSILEKYFMQVIKR
jgi:hypothetical protein